MKLLGRVWAGIVGAVAGSALAIVVQIAGQMAAHLSIDYLTTLVVCFAIGGFVAGFALGNRNIGTRNDKDQSDV